MLQRALRLSSMGSFAAKSLDASGLFGYSYISMVEGNSDRLGLEDLPQISREVRFVGWLA
jgi:hypothetical protein